MRAVIAAALAAACTGVAHAGVTWVARPAGGKATAERVIRISGERCRTDSADQAIVLRLDLGLIWTIDRGRRTYTEISLAELGEATERARHLLRDLPAEEREAMEKLLFGTGGEVRREPLGRTLKVQGRRCRLSRVDAGLMRATVCEAEALEFPAEAREFYAALAALAERTPGLEAVGRQAAVYRGLDGTPLREEAEFRTAAGKHREVYELQSIESGDVPDSWFEVDPGWRKVDASGE